MTRNFSIALLCTIISFSLTNCKKQTNDTENAVFEKTDAYVERMIDSSGIIGLNYAVLIDGKLAHKKAFGLANLDHKIPMTLEKLFSVASISKLFSSTALHHLLDKNKRNVDETVGDFLSERNDLPDSWKQLTLKQLLSHTSGIPDQIDYQIYLAPESEAFVIESMKDKPFSSKPGTESKYNATGFLIIRMLIEKLAKQDFESYMQTEYFDKLQLKNANYGGFKKVVSNRVTSYQTRNNKLEMFPLNYSSPMYAGAGLNIDINELIIWFQAVLKEQIIPQEQLDKIWTPVELNNGEDGYFGQGWVARRLADTYRMVGHGGAGISSFAHYWNEKTEGTITVIVLTNGAENWTVRPERINAEIANVLLSN